MPVLGTLGGAIVAGMMTLAASSRRTLADREIARQQLETQLRLAQQQHKADLDAEREKQRRQKIDEAYGQLMVWLHEMQAKIDDVWVAVYSDDSELIERARHILYEWAFETLRPPKEAVPTQYYWSESVRRLLLEIGGVSEEFTSAANAALLPINHSAEEDTRLREALQSTRGKVGTGRDRLNGVINHIHKTVRTEMRGRDNVD